MGSQNFYNGMTLSVAKAGLAAGTTSTYTTAAATAGFIEGVFATALAAQTNTATPTTDASGDAFTALAASEACVFVFGIVAAGTIAVQQGPVVAMDADTDEPLFNLEFPSVLDTVMPFGYAVIKNGSTGSAWTFGSSNWTATGVVDTYSDVGSMPFRPVSV